MKDFANLEGALYGLLVMGLLAPVLELITKNQISTTALMASLISIFVSLVSLRFVKKHS